MKVFITGGTGFIGSKIVEFLIRRGYSVKVLVRKITDGKKQTANEKIEYVQGDILDIESVRNGMKDCRYVFHLAAYAKNWSPNPKTFDEVNIRGTENIFTAASGLNVEKIVWASTIVTLGPTAKGVIGNEYTPRITGVFFTDYERSKTEMEHKAEQWVKDGLPLVIVNPTRVFGPGLLSESNSVTKLIDNHRKCRFPFLLNWGRNIGNYAYVDDVAEGHILALEKGRIGERYILGGENVSMKELFDTVSQNDGKNYFQWKIYCVIPLCISYLLALQAKLTGIYPTITPGWIRTFLTDWAYTSEKAEKELGYSPLPLKEAIRRTCEWLDSQK
ncbi:NAD-dependent dehydratase [Planctomycetales bacterium]|nr:NAD-dependent dehydratase [Planctomycetales bacterium]